MNYQDYRHASECVFTLRGTHNATEKKEALDYLAALDYYYKTKARFDAGYTEKSALDAAYRVMVDYQNQMAVELEEKWKGYYKPE